MAGRRGSRRQWQIPARAIHVALVTLALGGILGVCAVAQDVTAPVLTVPPDTAIGCADSVDPSNTGQASATDDTDPSPTITYHDGEGYADGGNTTRYREWTATDASGNSTSDTQTITVTAPPVTIQAASPDVITSLPATVTVKFTVTGCAVSSEAYLQAHTPPQDEYWSGVGSVVSDGSSVNTLTITVPADAADGDYRIYLWVISDENVAFYNEIQDYLTVFANTAGDLVITETDGGTEVTEGIPAVDLVKVQFNGPPTANVDVVVTPDSQLDVGEGAGMPYTFHYIYGVDSWDRQFEIECGANDDAIVEGTHTGQLSIVTSSTDSNFDGLTESVAVDITDNDSPPPGLTIVESEGGTYLEETKYEDWSDSFTIVLDSQPTASVLVTVDPDDQSFVDGYAAGEAVVLTFTTLDWDEPQEIVMIAADDDVIEGDHTSTISITTASTDLDYFGLSASVIADIKDFDSATILIDVPDPHNIALEEGIPQTWYTFLATQPTADVDWILNPDSQLDIGAGPGVPVRFAFTPADFDTPQEFIILAVDDFIDEGDHVGVLGMSVESTCPYYGALDDGSWEIPIKDSDSVPPAIIPTGETGGLLDVGLPEGFVPEGEDPPTIGGYTLSAVCAVGQPLTGGCEILGTDGHPMVTSWIIVELYRLTFDGNEEILTQLSHEIVTYDWATHQYKFSCDTSELEPGYYILYLAFRDGSHQRFCIEVIADL